MSEYKKCLILGNDRIDDLAIARQIRVRFSTDGKPGITADEVSFNLARSEEGVGFHWASGESNVCGAGWLEWIIKTSYSAILIVLNADSDLQKLNLHLNWVKAHKSDTKVFFLLSTNITGEAWQEAQGNLPKDLNYSEKILSYNPKKFEGTPAVETIFYTLFSEHAPKSILQSTESNSPGVARYVACGILIFAFILSVEFLLGWFGFHSSSDFTDLLTLQSIFVEGLAVTLAASISWNIMSYWYHCDRPNDFSTRTVSDNLSSRDLTGNMPTPSSLTNQHSYTVSSTPSTTDGQNPPGTDQTHLTNPKRIS